MHGEGESLTISVIERLTALQERDRCPGHVRRKPHADDRNILHEGAQPRVTLVDERVFHGLHQAQRFELIGQETEHRLEGEWFLVLGDDRVHGGVVVCISG